MTTDSEQIVAEMERIRSAKSVKLAQLSQQSQRLTDWREYVRSAPVASLVGSIMVGAMLGNRMADKPSSTVASQPLMASHESRGSENGPRPTLATRLLSTATAFAVPLITNAAKRQVMSGLNTLVRKLAEQQQLQQLEQDDWKHDQQSIQ